MRHDHGPHSSYQALSGEALDRWGYDVSDKLHAGWPTEAGDLTLTLTWIVNQEPDAEGRRDLQGLSPLALPAVERLRELGVLFIFYTQGRRPGAVRLHAYDPPAPWPIPSDPKETPQ